MHMKYLRSFQHLYRTHFLLATTASLIIIGFVGSVNVFLISMHPPSFYWMTLLFITVMATMRFLAVFLARFPIPRIFEAALTGVLIQIFLLIFIHLN